MANVMLTDPIKEAGATIKVAYQIKQLISKIMRTGKTVTVIRANPPTGFSLRRRFA
jgi:hypothetical protein